MAAISLDFCNTDIRVGRPAYRAPRHRRPTLSTRLVAAWRRARYAPSFARVRVGLAIAGLTLAETL